MAAVTVCSHFEAPPQKKRKSVTASTISPYVCHEVMGSDAMVSFFHVEFQAGFFILLFQSHQETLVPLYFLLFEWYHLHVWASLVA